MQIYLKYQNKKTEDNKWTNDYEQYNHKSIHWAKDKQTKYAMNAKRKEKLIFH